MSLESKAVGIRYGGYVLQSSKGFFRIHTNTTEEHTNVPNFFTYKPVFNQLWKPIY
ncbi:UNVERIFIED_CONTAM: hypothetical protein FKN15_013346 [Acipenser sinensis]